MKNINDMTKKEIIKRLEMENKYLKRDFEFLENKIKENEETKTAVHNELSNMYVKLDQLFQHDNLQSILNKPLIPILNSIYADLTKADDIIQWGVKK